MKKIRVFFLMMAMVMAVGFGMNSAMAIEAEEADSPFTVELTLDGMSKYLGDAGTVYEDGPVMQAGLNLEHVSGLYASIWSSIGMENEDGDEVDFILGWAGDIGGGFALDVGGGYWDFSRMFRGRADNAWDLYVELSYDFEVVEAYAKADGMLMEPDSSFEGGFIQYIGLRRELEFERVEGLTFSGDAYVAIDDGTFGVKSCTSAQLRLSADYEVMDDLSIGYRVAVSLPFDPDEDDGREQEFVWGVGLAYTF